MSSQKSMYHQIWSILQGVEVSWSLLYTSSSSSFSVILAHLHPIINISHQTLRIPNVILDSEDVPIIPSSDIHIKWFFLLLSRLSIEYVVCSETLEDRWQYIYAKIWLVEKRLSLVTWCMLEVTHNTSMCRLYSKCHHIGDRWLRNFFCRPWGRVPDSQWSKLHIHLRLPCESSL